MSTRPLSLGLGMALAGLLLAGCGTSQPARYYVLSAPQGHDAPEGIPAHLEGAKIALARVRVPKHLARAPIVTQRSEVELVYSEFHRWGQPLTENLGEVVILNLQGFLPGTMITPDRMALSGAAWCVVHLEVPRLEGTLGSGARMEARWTVVAASGGTVLTTGGGTYSQSLDSEGYDAYVAALNRMVLEMSRDLARDLRGLPRTPPANGEEPPEEE